MKHLIFLTLLITLTYTVNAQSVHVGKYTNLVESHDLDIAIQMSSTLIVEEKTSAWILTSDANPDDLIRIRIEYSDPYYKVYVNDRIRMSTSSLTILKKWYITNFNNILNSKTHGTTRASTQGR